MGIAEHLQNLALHNRFGLAFLLAYGLTWLVTGVSWLRLAPSHAALTTLFQGVVALPLALALGGLVANPAVPRPSEPLLDQVSIYFSMTQVLGLPLVIHFYLSKSFAIVPFTFATTVGMHFALYSWLYQTPLYVVMGAAIVSGGFVITRLGEDGRIARADSGQLVHRCADAHGGGLLRHAVSVLTADRTEGTSPFWLR